MASILRALQGGGRAVGDRLVIQRSASLFKSSFSSRPSPIFWCSTRRISLLRNLKITNIGATDVGRFRRFYSNVGALGPRAAAPALAEFAVAEDDRVGGWTAEPDSDGGLEVARLDIDKDIINALARKGITKLFPIQREVLEPAMQGRDMIGRARTGTGKTLAFGIPILNRIIEHNRQNGRGYNPLALALAPTRELARQVEKEFMECAPCLDTLCCYGGVPIHSQISVIRRGLDVIVGTPGRIIDLINRGALNLSDVQFVVLDEADQMLAVGFDEDVETIMQRLPKKRQSMLFSATLPAWVQKLSKKYLTNPMVIDLVGDSPQKLADGITLYSITASTYGKRSILSPLITEYGKGGKCIVFTQTKRDADRLAMSMGQSLGCQALHGDISQNQREKTLAGFRDGRFNVLIATDVAARGLDIPNVDLIIHYEIPTSSEIFVHRSGRTGRAGKKGTAILIYSQEQIRTVRNIEQDVGCKFNELPRMKEEIDDMSGFRGDFGMNRFGGSRDSRFGISGRSQYSGSEAGYGRNGGGYGTSGGRRTSPQGSRFDNYGDRPYQSYNQFDRNSGDSRSRYGGYGERSNF